MVKINPEILRCFWFADWKETTTGEYRTLFISEDHSLDKVLQRIATDLKNYCGAVLSFEMEDIPPVKRWDMSPASPKKTKYILTCKQ